MATTDNELKKLNANVSEALRILKLYVGSSGQLKAMNEKQKEAIDTFAEAAQQEEENQKKQRAFAKRERDEKGRFIKKQNDNELVFLGMAKSVVKLFGKIGNGIGSGFKKVASGISSHLSSLYNEIKSHFLGLFGEESEWFGILGSIKDSVKKFGGTLFQLFFKKTPAWAKKMNDYLKGLYHLQIKEFKMSFLKTKGKTGSNILGLLGQLFLAIGAAMGTLLDRYFILIKKLPIWGKISRMFESMEEFPFIGKFIKIFRKSFKWIKKLFKWIKKGFKWIKKLLPDMKVLEEIPMFGKLFSLLKFGLEKLALPITIILSFIDFIKGFNKTQGSLFNKVKGGLWEVFKGFIDLPVKIIGWLVEKVASMFGIKIKGVADKIMNIIHKLFDMSLDGWKMIFDLTAASLFGRGDIKKIEKNIGNVGTYSHNVGSPIKRFKIDKKAKEESVKRNNKKALDNMGKISDGIKKNSDAIGSALNQILQNNQYGGVGDVKQVPDELDNGLLSVKSYNGGFD